ncbi:hypothetical protein NDU88_004584 [Pleurodeles waltl]|uniref:Uncharacterized protein n=1 Tax=Pleurodeles waltl TaxID=8319 RepID=A0AAV7KYC6_PLEWA|nr:hypothetical protein NDU88_004584 [Pleurodeles waltl]
MASPVRASYWAGRRGGPRPLPASVQAGSSDLTEGRSATGSSRSPRIWISWPRGRGDFAGPRGPCNLPLLWPLGAIGLCGTRIAEGRERGGPGSGSGADPEWKGLVLRSVVAGSAGHCGVDCPWSCVLAWWGPSWCGALEGPPVLSLESGGEPSGAPN